MITSKDPKTTFLKDLKKEMYFTENRLTTLEEMKALDEESAEILNSILELL